jgi:transmembrane sensor
MNDILSKLLARKLSGEASQEELLQLDQLLDNNEENQFIHETLQSYWKPNNQTLEDLNEDAHFNFVLDQAISDENDEYIAKDYSENNEKKEIHPQFFSFKKIAIAASTIALLGIGWVLLKTDTGKNIKANTYSNELLAKPGKKMRLLLPDGTQIWLNSDSKINYNKAFDGKTREVVLVGEAFFDVAKDKTRPFIIHTKAMDIKVLGTAFNVKAYPSDKTTEASLVHGSIEASFIDRPNEKIILKPNEKIVFTNNLPVVIEKKKAIRNAIIIKNNDPIITVKKINYEVDKKDSLMVETVWMKNTIAFRAEPLVDVVTKIERWYDVHIIIKNEKLKTKIFTGTFNDETITEVMNALSKSGNINYKKSNNNISIF